MRLGSLPDDWLGGAAIFRASACYMSGDRAGMDEAERAIDDTARRWGVYWQFWLELIRFGRAFIGGRLAAAAASVGRVEELETLLKSHAASSGSALQTFLVRRERGTLGAVRGLITGNESPADRWAPGLLALYTEFGMQTSARRLLHWMLEHDDERSHASSDWPATLTFLAEAAVELDDIEACTTIRPWLAEYSGLNLVSGFFNAPFGSADRLLARIDGVRRADATALDLLEAALHLDEQSDADLHVAETLARRVQMLRRIGARSATIAPFAERARSIAEPLQLVRVLRMLGLSSASAIDSDAVLSPRELEVVRLVAEGFSNRAIAAELFISEHTAANHVRSILMKTGAANRTQAAMSAREHGLL